MSAKSWYCANVCLLEPGGRFVSFSGAFQSLKSALRKLLFAQQSAERRAQSAEKSHLKLSKKQSAGALYVLCGLFVYGDYLIFPPEQFRRHLLC